MSEPSFDEFETMFRRVFILYLDAVKDFITSLENEDLILTETIEEKHQSITKFVSYCLRILNKRGFSNQIKNNLYYHTLETIDKLSHTLKYGARFIVDKKMKLNKKCITLLKGIEESISLYYELFYKFDINNVTKFYENRDNTLNSFYSQVK